VRASISSIEVFVVTPSIAAFSAASDRSPDPVVTARRWSGEAPLEAPPAFVVGSGFFDAEGDVAPFPASGLDAGVGEAFLDAAASASDVTPSSAGAFGLTFCFQPSATRGVSVEAPPGVSGGWAAAGLAIKPPAVTPATTPANNQAPAVTAEHRPCGIIVMLRAPLAKHHRQPSPSGWSDAGEGFWSG
jgi:hypothetical protein